MNKGEWHDSGDKQRADKSLAPREPTLQVELEQAQANEHADKLNEDVRGQDGFAEVQFDCHMG